SGAPPMLDYLTSLLTSENPAKVRLGLDLIALAPGITYQEEWSPVFERALEAGAGDDLFAAAITALEATRSEEFSASLEAICRNEEVDTALRFSAAKALLPPEKAIAPAAFDLCEATLERENKSTFRSQAVALLTGAVLGE